MTHLLVVSFGNPYGMDSGTGMGERTISIDWFEILMTMSIVELRGRCMVVFDSQPSETSP